MRTKQKKYVRPLRDKTKLQITKKNILMIIRSAGQMLSCRKGAVVWLNCIWFTKIINFLIKGLYCIITVVRSG